jgi:hypothetical protein
MTTENISNIAENGTASLGGDNGSAVSIRGAIISTLRDVLQGSMNSKYCGSAFMAVTLIFERV